ncbi:MAG: hypothetical protein ACRDSJ_16680 [Rubrobacteraceae bacterium]
MSGNVKEWRDPDGLLSGTFSIRARGFFGSEFVLSDENGEFGLLRLEGSGEASFESGGLSGRIEREGLRYRMFTGNRETLTAIRSPSGGLRIEVGEKAYEASVSLVRNEATATSSGGEAVRVAGGLTNRRYEVSFEGEGSLPVAIFLLYHLAASRRRAFRAEMR